MLSLCVWMCVWMLTRLEQIVLNRCTQRLVHLSAQTHYWTLITCQKQAFIDIRLFPGTATLFMAVAARCSLYVSTSRPLRPNVTSSINRKYITYRNATRGGSSHGHGGAAHKMCKSAQRFQRYTRGQTDRLTDTQTNRQTDGLITILCTPIEAE